MIIAAELQVTVGLSSPQRAKSGQNKAKQPASFSGMPYCAVAAGGLTAQTKLH